MTEAIRITSAMSALVRGAQAYFTAAGSDAEVLFGYRERAKQLNQGGGRANRVIFLPGDPNGAGGKMEAAPRDVGPRPIFDADNFHVADVRPLASWARQFTISIWGWDATAPRDELAQAAATEDLFELTLRAVEAVRGAGGPNLGWGSIAWTVAKENTLGSELLVGVALTHPLMDAPVDVGFPGFEIHRVGT